MTEEQLRLYPALQALPVYDEGDERNLHGLKAAVVIEVQPRELAHAKFAVDLYQRVDFFSRIAVGFEAVFCLKQLNLCRVRRFRRLFLRSGGGFLFRRFR